MQLVRFDDPGGAREFTGHWVIKPLKHTSPDTHISHLEIISAAGLYPGLHKQEPTALEPAGDVKFTAHDTIRSLFPPAQYEPLVHMGHGLVPDLEPLPKYPGAQRHWFCEEERAELKVLLGHAFNAPAMHQELRVHAEHTPPLR